MKGYEQKNHCVPSHLSFSEAPQDSHLPASRGNPRNGFPSWLGWVTGHSLTEYVHFRNQKKKAFKSSLEKKQMQQTNFWEWCIIELCMTAWQKTNMHKKGPDPWWWGRKYNIDWFSQWNVYLQIGQQLIYIILPPNMKTPHLYVCLSMKSIVSNPSCISVWKNYW